MVMILGDVNLHTIVDGQLEDFEIRSTSCVIRNMDSLVTIDQDELVQCPRYGGREVLVNLRLQAQATCCSYAKALRTSEAGIPYMRATRFESPPSVLTASAIAMVGVPVLVRMG